MLLGERLLPDVPASAPAQNGTGSAVASAATDTQHGGDETGRATTDSIADSRPAVPEGASLQPAPSDVDMAARVTMQDDVPQPLSPRTLSEEAAQSEWTSQPVMQTLVNSNCLKLCARCHATGWYEHKSSR